MNKPKGDVRTPQFFFDFECICELTFGSTAYWNRILNVDSVAIHSGLTIQVRLHVIWSLARIPNAHQSESNAAVNERIKEESTHENIILLYLYIHSRNYNNTVVYCYKARKEGLRCSSLQMFRNCPNRI